MTDNVHLDSHAMVIGASSGIGYALAERLGTIGQVTAVARRIENMQLLADTGAHIAKCDVSEIDTIESVVTEAVAVNGKITQLIYCAGQQLIRPIRTTSAKHAHAMIGVNLLAPLEFARLFASKKLAHPEAVFCAVSSIAAQRPEPGILTYSCAKAALEALIRGMARELSPKRAVGVAPGWLDTEMTQSLPNIYTDEFKRELNAKSPRGIATVDSIVDTIEFVLSEKSNYLTGQIITVDGRSITLVDLHHVGYVVKDITAFSATMPGLDFEKSVYDPLQQAQLSLYKLGSHSRIELIEPKQEAAFTWSWLDKHGSGLHHICYSGIAEELLDDTLKQHRLVKVLGPVHAVLFDRPVVFAVTRQHSILEFLL